VLIKIVSICFHYVEIKIEEDYNEKTLYIKRNGRYKFSFRRARDDNENCDRVSRNLELRNL